MIIPPVTELWISWYFWPHSLDVKPTSGKWRFDMWSQRFGPDHASNLRIKQKISEKFWCMFPRNLPAWSFPRLPSLGFFRDFPVCFFSFPSRISWPAVFQIETTNLHSKLRFVAKKKQFKQWQFYRFIIIISCFMFCLPALSPHFH